MFPWIGWRRWLGGGRSGLLCLVCCPCDPAVHRVNVISEFWCIWDFIFTQFLSTYLVFQHRIIEPSFPLLPCTSCHIGWNWVTHGTPIFLPVILTLVCEICKMKTQFQSKHTADTGPVVAWISEKPFPHWKRDVQINRINFLALWIWLILFERISYQNVWILTAAFHVAPTRRTDLVELVYWHLNKNNQMSIHKLLPQKIVKSIQLFGESVL